METLLKPLKKGTLSSQVFDLLKAAIFSGEFQPGDPLLESSLARDLNVSQATVRAALVQLEHLGLVVRVPNKGTTVTRLSRQEIAERMLIRLVLEEMAFIAASQQMSEENYAELKERLNAMAAAIRDNAYFDEAQADLEFHRYVWEHSGNRTLYQTLDQLAVPLFAFVSILRLRGEEDLRVKVPKHEELIAALRSKDPETIRKALASHHHPINAIPEAAS